MVDHAGVSNAIRNLGSPRPSLRLTSSIQYTIPYVCHNYTARPGRADDVSTLLDAIKLAVNIEDVCIQDGLSGNLNLNPVSCYLRYFPGCYMLNCLLLGHRSKPKHGI